MDTNLIETHAILKPLKFLTETIENTKSLVKNSKMS